MNSKAVKKTWGVISTILVIIVVAATLLLVGTKFIGFQPYAVLSGSMEPTYHVGSLIYVKKVSPSEVQVGDPITFVMNEDLVVATHRVVEIDSVNQYFITKGDANEFIDAAPVHFNNLIGVPKASIPKLGYLANFIQNPPGKYIAIAFAAILLLLAFLPSLFDDDKDNKKKKKKRKSKSEIEEDIG